MTAHPKTQHAIVQLGDPVLRKKAKAVTREDFGSPELLATLRHMKKALDAEADGVAIAAPQIGVPLRIFIVSYRAFALADETKQPARKGAGDPMPEKDLICINPEFIKLAKKKIKVPEGCLSVRWKYGNTMRHEKATIRARDEHGRPFTYGGSGLIAQIFQHETDHLNGTLFIDHATDIEEMTAEEVAAMQDANKKQRSAA